jgi:EpsI family protein
MARIAKLRGDWVFLAVILGLLVLSYRDLFGWNPGRDLSEEVPALFVASNTSPLYISSLAALFLYLRIHRLATALRAPAPSRWGWWLVGPAALVLVWAQYTGARDILLLSVIPMVLGGAWVAVGSAFARLLLLPTLFLLFMYPMPAVLANQQVYAFQMATAELTASIVRALGIPVILQGDHIYVANRVFQVIETCSGLRLTETLFSSAFAYVEVMRTRRRHAVIIVLLSPLLAFPLNTLRVLLIMFNPLSDYSADHTLQGIGVVVVGVLSFALVEKALKRFYPQPPPPPFPRPDPSQNVALPKAWALLAVAVVCLSASFAIDRWQASAPPRWTVTMPIEWDGWKARKAPVDEQFLGSVYYSRRLSRRYEKGGDDVWVLAARDDRLKRDRSILSPKNALPGGGWETLERHRLEAPWTHAAVEEIVATKRGKQRLILYWYEGSEGLGTEAIRAVLGVENSSWRQRQELRMFRVSTNLPRGEIERQSARERVEKFAREIRDSLDG